MVKHRDIVTLEVLIDAAMDVVWKCWITPADIIKWNNASEDWHTPDASNDLRKGGKFTYRIEAKKGSVGFDFGGTYGDIIDRQEINYTLEDGRRVRIIFMNVDHKVQIIESFEVEDIHPIEMQQQGWQAILDNFQKYVEHQLPKR